MDFYSFVRKDLQSLCKLNKIPANRTNVAMAEALSSLKTVKGIEKFCKLTESSVAESSVESPEKNVVTSPKTTRTGRRKIVREGTGVLQTVTPVTRKKNRVPVASVKTVQTVYNTRLSARLSKKEVMEVEKKECVEAVKISSYCDVVSDNDFGEVSEDKNVSGFDNVGVESLVSEIEQESDLMGQDADNDLKLRNKAATNIKSKVPGKNDDVGGDLCLSKTDITTQVIAHEGSFDVGLELSVSEIEQESESLKGINADKDLDSENTAATNIEPEVLENNGLQVGPIEAVLEIPIDDNMAVIDQPLHNEKDDVGGDLCLSKTDITTQVIAHEASFDVGLELPVSEIEQESESLKGINADKDLDSKSTAATNIEPKVLENNGLPVGPIEDVLEMPIDDNMAVIDQPLHNEKDDVGDDLCLSKVDISINVLAHEGSVDVGDESPVSEIEQESKSLKWKYADIDLESGDTVATHKKSKLLENSGLQVDTSLEVVSEMPSNDNMVILDKKLCKKKDDVGADLCLSKVDISTKVLAHEGSVDVGAESPISGIEQERESLKWNCAGKDLDLSGTATTNMKSKVIANNGLQVDSMFESVLGMPSDDNMVVIDTLLHNKKDDVGVDLCPSKTDVSTEMPAHTVKVFQIDTENAVVETPTNEKKGAISSISLPEKGSFDVEYSFSGKEFQSESSKRVYGESSDAELTTLTDLKVLVLNGKGSYNIGVDLSVSEIEEQSESMNGKNADKDLDSGHPTATYMRSKVLERNGLQVDNVEAVLEMPSNDNMAIVDQTLNNEKDDVELDLYLSKPDVLTEVLANEEPTVEMPSHDSKAVADMPRHKKSDDVVDDISLSALDMTTEVLAHEVELLTIDTQKAVVQMPVHKTKAVEQVFSPQKNGPDDVGVHFTFVEGSDNAEVQFSFLENDEIVDAAVTHSTNSKEIDSLKEHLELESSEKVKNGELVQDLMIQPKSDKIVLENWSSAANSIVDGENLDVTVKFQQDISCNKESGCVYDNGKSLASQEEVSGKAVTSDLKMCSESCERNESSIHNEGNYDSSDTDIFQHNVSSKQSDSKRKLVSEIFSCNNAVEFVDQLEMPGSVEVSNDFSAEVTFVDKLGNENRLVDDPDIPESSSEATDDDVFDIEALFDFPEHVLQEDKKRESIASQILCGSYTKEPADQSDTLDSFASPVPKILSCNRVIDFADRLELSDSFKGTDDFSGRLTFIDESGDKDKLADDPESSSEAFNDNVSDAEAGSDFLEHAMQLDKKRESIASQILCGSYTEEPADLSDTSDSFDSSAGFSSKVTRYSQLVSDSPLTKESRLRVESDVSDCCSGIKKMSFDESAQAYELKSPSFFKRSGQMCPSSAPPVLLPRKAKITCDQPLIVADHPFTQKFMSSGVQALEPTFKLKGNVSKDKENIEQNENQVEVTKEKPHNDKNEIPVCKKSDVGLYVRSPR